MDNLHTFRAGDLIVLNFNNNAANDNIKAIVLPSTIDGSQGEDTIEIQGSPSTTSIIASAGNDIIVIQGSPNTIIGSAGNDTISIIAHNGNDIIVIQDSVPNSTIDSGGGNDTIVIERADLVKKYIHSPDGNDSITAQQKSDVINGYNTGEVQGTEFQGGLVGSAAAEISKGFNKEFSKEIKLIHAEIYGKSLNKEAQTIPQNMIDNAGNIFKITVEETFIGKDGEGNQISTTDNASITPNIFASLLKEISDKTLSSRLDTEFESELLSNGIIKDNEIVIVASNFDNSIIL